MSIFEHYTVFVSIILGLTVVDLHAHPWSQIIGWRIPFASPSASIASS